MKIMDKFGDMLMAIVVFALVVVLIVALAWLVGQIRTRASGKVQGFIYILPVLIMLLGGLVYLRSWPSGRRSAGRPATRASASRTSSPSSPRPGAAAPLINTAIWVICVGLRDHRRPRLRRAGRPLAVRGVREGADLPCPAWPSRWSAPRSSGGYVRLPGGGETQVGLFNAILTGIGFQPVDFMQIRWWNTFFLIVVMVWIQAGFAMTVLSAAIKGIPDEIIEAAKIDGTTGWKLFRFIMPEHPWLARGGAHHGRHRDAEGLRRGAHDDRRSVRHLRACAGVLQLLVPLLAVRDPGAYSRSSCSSWCCRS